MDAMEVLLGRSSPTVLGLPGPDDISLQKILLAAMRAPDHGRMRPWRILLVKGAARGKLGDAFAAALKRRDGSAAEAQMQAERAKALRAPLIIIVSATIRDNPKVPPVEQIVSTGAAVQNILLAAHALGYGAMWRTGAIAYDTEFKRTLGLTPEDVVVGILYVGTPVTVPVARNAADMSMYVREWDDSTADSVVTNRHV